MKAAGIAAAVIGAIALQMTLAHIAAGAAAMVDLALVVVVYVSLSSGPVAGLLSGACAGLVQDALASGVIGVGSLAKTLVGFLAGSIGMQFIVAQPLPRFVVFFGATLLNGIVFFGLYMLLDVRRFDAPYVTVAGQAVGNAVVGVAAFELAEFLPGAVERRRMAQHRLRR